MAISTIDAGADLPAKQPARTRPDKPDEGLFKEELAKAEKAYSLAQETFVSSRLVSII